MREKQREINTTFIPIKEINLRDIFGNQQKNLSDPRDLVHSNRIRLIIKTLSLSSCICFQNQTSVKFWLCFLIVFSFSKLTNWNKFSISVQQFLHRKNLTISNFFFPFFRRSRFVPYYTCHCRLEMARC